MSNESIREFIFTSLAERSAPQNVYNVYKCVHMYTMILIKNVSPSVEMQLNSIFAFQSACWLRVEFNLKFRITFKSYLKYKKYKILNSCSLFIDIENTFVFKFETIKIDFYSQTDSKR